MNKTFAKRILVYHICILVYLILIACSSSSPTPDMADEIDQIQVQKTTESIETSLRTEEFKLPNCGGSSELSVSLGTQTSVKKGITIGSKATLRTGVEVEIPATAKAKLEAAVELAYQQAYETATSRLDTIIMKAAPVSHVVYVIQWDEHRFESTIGFNLNREPGSTTYGYVLTVPKISNSYQVSCPTPTIDEKIAADATATAVAKQAAADSTATIVAGKIIWEQNWLQIKERFRGVLCCPEGKTITNRERYLLNLNGLDLSTDSALQDDLDNLIALIEGAETYPDPNWNIVLTDEIEFAYDKLETDIRNKAIEYGVNVSE